MRKIDEKAIPFLKEKGYGKGTNYTTDLVASLMIQFTESQGQTLPIDSVSNSLRCEFCDNPATQHINASVSCEVHKDYC